MPRIQLKHSDVKDRQLQQPTMSASMSNLSPTLSSCLSCHKMSLTVYSYCKVCTRALATFFLLNNGAFNDGLTSPETAQESPQYERQGTATATQPPLRPVLHQLVQPSPLESRQFNTQDQRSGVRESRLYALSGMGPSQISNSLRNSQENVASHHVFRRCLFEGCTKCAQGSTKYCISHGGGRRCTFPGCNKGARDKYFCAAHGGGKRCTVQGCMKSAVGRSTFCTSHGGGKRCAEPGCTKSAQSSTRFCVRHGGGRKCALIGCNKVARGRTQFCTSHKEGAPSASRLPTPISSIGEGSNCLTGRTRPVLEEGTPEAVGDIQASSEEQCAKEYLNM